MWQYAFPSRLSRYTNKRTDALVVFRKVLSVAAQADLHQTILDQGPEIDLLLAGVREAARRGEEPPGLPGESGEGIMLR
jgi:hypothetical protein